MRRLVFTRSAQNDLVSILRYVAKESASRQVADALVADLIAKCQKLARLATVLGRTREDLAADLRSIPHGSYIIFFRYTADELRVSAILESHRDLAAVMRRRRET